MGKGIVIAILSFIFYLTNLLGGGYGQPIDPINIPSEQQSYHVLGQSGEVLAKQVTLRSAPQNEAEPIGILTENEQIIILDQGENWYKVRLKTGTEGWVPKYALSILTTNRKTNNKIVLGYYSVNETGYQDLLGQAEHLTTLIPLGWQLNSYGQIEEKFDPQKMGQSLYFAGNQEIETMAQIAFPENLSHLLENKYLQESSITTILATLESWGLKGILLEIPQIDQETHSKLFEYVNNIATHVAANNMQTFVALPWQEELDYSTISTNVDYLILKSPNQFNEPGPLATAPLLEQILEDVVQTIPREQIILALPNIGFDWPKVGPPVKLSHEEVLELAANQGASIKWDAESKTPYFHYGSGHEVWFENRYSFNYKLDLIDQYDIAGIAFLELGYEDPEIWETLAKTF